MVLTAAAADRVSFGCGAGRPLHLLRPVPAAAVRCGLDLEAKLAQATRTCVQNLEKSMGIRTPSQPQIFVGSAVAKSPGFPVGNLLADHGGEVARHLVRAVPGG